MAIFDTFDGAADQAISARAGWVKHLAASVELLSTNGSGAVKIAAYTSGVPAVVVHDTGSADHYAECVIGSGAIGAMAGALRLLVCRQVLGSVPVGINVIYLSSYDYIYLRNNDTTLAESGAAGVKLVAGDVLRLEVQGTMGRVYRNGVQILTATIPASSSTYAGFGGNANAAINPLVTEFSAGTLVPADATAPTFTGSITVGAKTSSTINLTLPTATDNVGVTGYEYRVNGGAWQDNGASTAVALTALTALTSYTTDARAYDAAGNRSTTLSVTTSTYRAGASAGSIVTATAPQDGNPAGPLYALAQTLPVDAWVSYYTVSGPTPAGGTLDAQPNGAGSYTGPSPATWVIQPEVNGTATGEPITVTLYDQEGGGGPAPDVTGPNWTGPISLLDRGTTTASLQLPTATDASGTVSYQYSLNGGAWQSTGTTVNLSGLTEATNYTLDARALDAVPNYSTTLSAAFTTRSSVVTGPPTERWNGTQWVAGGVFRRGNGSGSFVTGGRPRRWNGSSWS